MTGLIVKKQNKDPEVERMLTGDLSTRQKELLEALREKDIKRVKECPANVWATLRTLDALLLVTYNREIYGIDDLLNIISSEGIILQESTAKRNK